MIYVIVPVHNRISDTMAFIDCCASQKYKNFRLVVVDDGSTDGTYETISGSYSWVHVIKGDGNLWWTGAINLGIQYVLSVGNQDDHVMTINNDVRFGELFFQKIQNTISLNPEAVFNPISISDQDGKTVFFTGTKVVSWMLALKKQPYFGKSIDIAKRKGMIGVDYLNGRGTTMPITIFNRIGLYNQRKLPHYGADEEFTLRAKRHGYNLFIDPGNQIKVDSQTTGLNPLNKNLSLSEIFESFRSIKSTNNIKILYRYAQCCSPSYAFPTYFMISFFKICIYSFRSFLPIKIRII